MIILAQIVTGIAFVAMLGLVWMPMPTAYSWAARDWRERVARALLNTALTCVLVLAGSFSVFVLIPLVASGPPSAWPRP